MPTGDGEQMELAVADDIDVLDGGAEAIDGVEGDAKDVGVGGEMEMDLGVHAGDESVPSGLGTSTSVSMVRVDVWRESAKRVILPGKVRLRVVTVTLTGSPSWMSADGADGDGEGEAKEVVLRRGGRRAWTGSGRRCLPGSWSRCWHSAS